MDQQYVAAVIRSLRSLPSRRDLVRGLVAAGIGLSALRLPDAAAAKKKLKKRKKKKMKKRSCAQSCAACFASTQCPAGTHCHEGACQACDVCASGCRYATVQASVTDPAGPATVRLCAGTYTEKVTIDRDVQLIGAGDGAGAGNTILVGTGDDSVVTMKAGRTVTLQSMRITGGHTSGIGGGIQTDAALLTLAHCTVTGNRAVLGGGILNNSGGLVTLDHSDVTTNIATAFGGGVYNNLGTLTLRNGSSITGNTANSTLGSGGGVYNDSTVDPSGGRITGNLPDQCVNAPFGTGCPP